MARHEVEGYITIPITITVNAKDEDDAMDAAYKILTSDDREVYDRIDGKPYEIELLDSYKLSPWEQ